jgi:hypothetical protein
MRPYLSTFVAMLAGVTIAASQPTPQKASATVKVLLEDASPGWITINLGRGSGWLGDASDALALRYGKILVRCVVIEQVGEKETRRLLATPLRLPDSLNAMRQIAALSGCEIVELSPEVLLMRSTKGHCEEPLLITAEPVREVGVPLDPSIDVHALEVKLFQTVGSRTAGAYGLFGVHRDGLLYWASREGGGRELYVLSQSTDDLSTQYPTQRSLQKVAVEGTGKDLGIRRIWAASCGGAVARLELDLDKDGVTDVLCFSGRQGAFDGVMPLVAYSGAAGKRLGEIHGGEEWVITDLSSGYRIRTTGRLDDEADHHTYPIARAYTATAAGIALDQEIRGKSSDNWMPQILTAGATSLGAAPAGQAERVVAHFVIYPGGRPFPGVQRLERVGGEVPMRNEKGAFPSGVHVLLDYRPPQ